MSKETATKLRDESFEIYSDGKKEYMRCPECGRLFEAYLLCINTPYSKDGAGHKIKCRDCAIEEDGMFSLGREVAKLLHKINKNLGAEPEVTETKPKKTILTRSSKK